MITDTSCLSVKAQKVLAYVDKLIDLYEATRSANSAKIIELDLDEYNIVQKSINQRLKMDLKTDTYRGYKLTSKEKRARYSKRNFNKVFPWNI